MGVALLLVSMTGTVHPQSESSVDGARGGIPAGFELDNYVRYLQAIGRVPLGAWGLRPFSAPDVDSLTKPTGPHPWARSWMFARGKIRHFALLPITATASYKSAFQLGGNDGAVWSGRGLTTSLQGGIAAAWGPVTLVLQPVAFRAENQGFALQPNGLTGHGAFANADFPNNIDLPQRFGNAPYSRVDPGQSTLRVDILGMTAGFSTANQYWGPATVFPVILGNNAAGIPHAFFGTQHPTNIGIGRVQARVVYGLESQSAFSPVTGPDTFTTVAQPGRKRFMSGLVTTFSPGAIPGLELGAARFFHQAWAGRITSSELQSPFEGILKSSISPGYVIPGSDNKDALKNQLASLFGRWVLPESGFELYAEYGHEDHNADLRDLESEPDHSRLAMVGFRKVFQRSPQAFSALRFEYIDGSNVALARHRGEGSAYIHSVLKQGHTQLGQLLGANVGAGSPAGANLSWETYSASGRTTWYVQRVVQNNESTLLTYGNASTAADLLLATIGYEQRRFGRIADLTYAAAVTEGKRGMNLGRETNISATVTVTTHLP